MNLIRQAIGQLHSGNQRHAARLFLESYQMELLPRGLITSKQLSQIINKDDFSRLISALAHLPCFCCRKGIVQCDNCQGKGRLGRQDICETCLGLGVAPCKFCGGTGWISLEDLPAPFTGEVLKQRQRIALHRISAVRDRLHQESQSEKPHFGFKGCVNEFLRLHRQLSVLEAGLVLLTTKTANNHFPQDQIDRLLKVSVEQAIQAWRHIRGLLQAMAQRLIAEAEKTDQADTRRPRLKQRAEYYRSLCETFDYLKGSEWEHTLLYQNVRELKVHHHRKQLPKKQQNNRQEPSKGQEDMNLRRDAVKLREGEGQGTGPHHSPLRRTTQGGPVILNGSILMPAQKG